jgi:hypothetical protein
MSEALPFAQVELASPQCFLCPLPIRDVLDCAEHQVGSSRDVLLQVSQAVHGTHLAAGTNDAVFGVAPLACRNSLLGRPEDVLSILGVDHFADRRDLNWP